VLVCSDHPTATATTLEIVSKLPDLRALDAGELSNAAPIEVARFGVTANTLALGLVLPALDSTTASLAARIPVGRVGTPEDIGALVVYLASDEAAWVTGQTIHINGGAATT